MDEAIFPEETPSSPQPALQRVAVFFSTGDLGDVGRHVVLAALEIPSVSVVKVFARNVDDMLLKTKWKCACRISHQLQLLEEQQRQWEQHNFDKDRRVQTIELDCTTDSIVDHLQDVDAVITCLGNRQLFHPEESMATIGINRILEAAKMTRRRNGIQRVVVLSSVGISEDWPPMEWSTLEGRRLESFFRTVCWPQFQDLTGAEKAVRACASENPSLDFLLARTVLLSETIVPSGKWHLQHRKYYDCHPAEDISKMDCARFLVQEAIKPSLHRCAITVGGVPPSKEYEKSWNCEQIARESE